MERTLAAPLLHYKKILQDFPRNMMFCFAYGSGAFKQTNSADPAANMLDLVFAVRNPMRWHTENLRRNPTHYSEPMRLLGARAVTNFQESWGAKIYYNTLVRSSEGRLVKYGVISELSLVEDLLDWESLYAAGRLHKPVRVLVEPDVNSEIGEALVRNLHSAVHAAMLLMPEHFTERELYSKLAGLSYSGDFRMNFGEDRNKINNIVANQINEFRQLYAPVFAQFERYVDVPKNARSDGNAGCHQDVSPAARIHHLNHLPKKPRVKLVRAWTQGPRSKDTEDCLRAIAHDPDCGELLDKSLREIVARASVTQSLKGVVTAGIVKAVRYGAAKVGKMVASQDSPAGDKLLSAKPKEQTVKEPQKQ